MDMPFPEVAACRPSGGERSLSAGPPPGLPPLAAVVAAPPEAVVAAPPDAVVAAPPEAVVAEVLPELSPPQAARMLGARATAAPAVPRRVSTCRRVTPPLCAGATGSMSVI